MSGSAFRSFDPRAVGRWECRAWETYYRRKWVAFLFASVALVRSAFSLSWPRTFVGARFVLRANMKWAPFPDNDADAARALMRRFYRLLEAGLDLDHAAWLEVEWWRAHREHQRGSGPSEELVSALADLYAYVYSVDKRDVRQAAELRAEAMDVSDSWVDAGCDPSDPRLATERSLLIRSYAALLASVHA